MKMKKYIIALMIAQMIMFCAGIYLLVKEEIIGGIFIIFMNTIFFAINVVNLKKL